MPSPQGAAREAFRTALLGAGERVFGHRGYYDTRMVDIAREAGVSVGTLYNYFDGKEVILSEIVDAMHREFMGRIKSVDPGKDALERLRAILESSLGSLEEHAGLLSVFHERGAASESDVERIAGARFQQNYAEYLEIVRGALRAATRAGQVRQDLDLGVMTSVLTGGLNGLVHAWLLQGRVGRLTDAARPLITIFLEGASRR